MPQAKPIQVAIIEDDKIALECLSLLIDATPGYKCVDSFPSVEDALRNGFIGRPDVLLLDIHLPGMLGSEGAKIFRERFPQMQILMLTIYAEQDKIFESI